MQGTHSLAFLLSPLSSLLSPLFGSLTFDAKPEFAIDIPSDVTLPTPPMWVAGLPLQTKFVKFFPVAPVKTCGCVEVWVCGVKNYTPTYRHIPIMAPIASH